MFRVLAAIGIALAFLLTIGCSVPGADRADAVRGPLASLEVAGAAGWYPAFDPGVHHYAVRCADETRLEVSARAADGGARLTMLHSGRTAIGAIAETVAVDSGHDLAIEIRGGQETSTYYLHCIPPEFPDVTIEKRTEAVTAGLLLMTPGVRRTDISFLAIMDNNGVPRRVMRPNVRARNFRRYPDGRFSFSERGADGVERTVILDATLNRIDTVTLVDPLLPEHTGGHDFLITDNGDNGDNGNYLQMSYYPAQRDLSGFTCRDENGARPCSTTEPADDSIIQEVTPDGSEVWRWNSWDHVKIADCTIHRFPNDYAHLNSLHELDGDIVAGLRGCAQVLRIERATGAVVWQVGGSEPMRADRPAPSTGATRYLPVEDDPLGEFCGQHHVTATPAGSLLMFDNGNHCLGPRKDRPPVTRIVEYDISSGTAARFVREYRLPEEDGVAESGGGVTALPSGNWLVTWGSNGPRIAVSEVDTAGNEVFRMNMSRGGRMYGTGRVYRENEADIDLQPNYPVVP